MHSRISDLTHVRRVVELRITVVSVLPLIGRSYAIRGAEWGPHFVDDVATSTTMEDRFTTWGAEAVLGCSEREPHRGLMRALAGDRGGNVRRQHQCDQRTNTCRHLGSPITTPAATSSRG